MSAKASRYTQSVNADISCLREGTSSSRGRLGGRAPGRSQVRL